MDHFKEDIVSRRNPLLFNMLYIVCWIFVVVLGLYALILLQGLMAGYVFSGVLGLLAAALAVLLYFAKDELKCEYEYTFTNGTLDFAKVLRSARRKEMGSMNVANVAACGYVAGQAFAGFLARPNLEKKNWFLNRDGNLFYFYYEKENRKHLIVIEPSGEMVDMIRFYLPAGVYQD